MIEAITQELIDMHKKGILDGLDLAIYACDIAIIKGNLTGVTAENFREFARCLHNSKLRIEKEI